MCICRKRYVNATPLRRGRPRHVDEGPGDGSGLDGVDRAPGGQRRGGLPPLCAAHTSYLDVLPGRRIGGSRDLTAPVLVPVPCLLGIEASAWERAPAADVGGRPAGKAAPLLQWDTIVAKTTRDPSLAVSSVPMGTRHGPRAEGTGPSLGPTQLEKVEEEHVGRVLQAQLPARLQHLLGGSRETGPNTWSHSGLHHRVLGRDLPLWQHCLLLGQRCRPVHAVDCTC